MDETDDSEENTIESMVKMELRAGCATISFFSFIADESLVIRLDRKEGKSTKGAGIVINHDQAVNLYNFLGYLLGGRQDG